MSAIATSSRTQTSKFSDEERIVTSGVTVNDGDLVTLVSGAVSLATASTKLYGVVRGGENSNLVSRTYRAPTTVGDGTKTVLVELVEGYKYKMPVSAALASDAEGKYYLITGGTGAQTVDNTTKSATVGQLLCVKRVADSTGAYLFGIFVVATPQSATTIS